MPRQLFPIKKHHEVWQVAFVITVGANLPHQVHAHGIAPNGKEQTMPQRQNTGVAPDQIHGQRANGVAHDFANQTDGVVAKVQPMTFRHHQIHEWHTKAHKQERYQKCGPSLACEQWLTSRQFKFGMIHRIHLKPPRSDPSWQKYLVGVFE